jgi:hypothetical protein
VDICSYAETFIVLVLLIRLLKWSAAGETEHYVTIIIWNGMMYFTNNINCLHYPTEWDDLVYHIKNRWPQNYAADLGDLEYHIEAKALNVFTIARHLIEKAEGLPARGNWKQVFVEASILLFPMIELIGEARMGDEPDAQSWRRLASGIDWLINPLDIPTRSNGLRNNLSVDETRISTLGSFMNSLRSGPKVKEIFHLRNYFIHGLKNLHNQDFDIVAIQTCMNFELPYAIIQQAKSGLATYWKQLKNENRDLPTDWVTHLAEADIYPFGIIGSNLFDKGLIDHDIIYWIESL